MPDYKVFHSITVKEVSYPGVLEAREAYNYAIDIKMEHGGEIILCKLINDKIKGNLNVQQEKHFYELLKIDNSTSGQAGFNYSNCLIETAILNSYKKRTIILALEEVPEKEKIKKNKKITILTPDKFITGIKIAINYKSNVDPESDFIDFLGFLFFVKPEIIEGICKRNNSKKK